MDSENFRLSSFYVPLGTQINTHSMITKIKICLYLLLVDHFFLLNGINCAKSSGVDFSSEAVEDLLVEKHIKPPNGMETFKSDESTFKFQEQKNCEDPDKNFTCPSCDNLFISTTETDHLQPKINLLEDKIAKIDMNFGLLHHKTIPNLCKAFNEIKSFYRKINEKIKEIRENSKNHDPELIDKIEQRNLVNIKVYDDDNVAIDKMRIKTEKLILAFENIKRKYRELNVNHSRNDLSTVFEYLYDSALEISVEIDKILQIITIVQEKLQKDKKQVEIILNFLYKFLEMTPEAFQAFKEMADLISSLK